MTEIRKSELKKAILSDSGVQFMIEQNLSSTDFVFEGQKVVIACDKSSKLKNDCLNTYVLFYWEDGTSDSVLIGK